MAVTGLLVGLYFALKREVFQCGGSKKDEEESLNHHSCLIKHEEEKEDSPDETKAEGKIQSLEEFYGGVGDDFYVDDLISKNDENLHANEPALHNENIELTEISSPVNEGCVVMNSGEQNDTTTEEGFSNEDLLTIPEAKVTTSSFVGNKPRRSSSFTKVFKKLNRRKSKSEDDNDLKPLYETEDVSPDLPFSSCVSLSDSVYKTTEMTKKKAVPGRIQVSAKYDEEEMELELGVRQGSALMLKGFGQSYWQICISLLPHKKHKFKTKYKETSTPIFKDLFVVKDIPKQILGQIGARFRIYGKLGRTSKRRFYGEVIMNLDFLEDSEEKFIGWYDIRGKAEREWES